MRHLSVRNPLLSKATLPSKRCRRPQCTFPSPNATLDKTMLYAGNLYSECGEKPVDKRK